jgi:hypothetical protein
MTAAVQEHVDFAMERVQDATAALRLLESAFLGLQASLSALLAVLAQEEPSEPPSALDEPTEAYGGVLGARPGDKLDLETMGGGQ